MYNPYNYSPANNNEYYNQQQQQQSNNYQSNQYQNQQPQYYGNANIQHQQPQQPVINPQQSMYDPYGGGNQQHQTHMNSYAYPSSNQVAGSYYPNQQQQQPVMTQGIYQNNANQYSPSYGQPYGNVPQQPYQHSQPSYPPQPQQPYQNSQPTQSYGVPSQSQPQVQQPYASHVQPPVCNQQQSYGCFPQASQVIDQSQYLYLQNYEQFYAQQKTQQPLLEPFVDPDFPPNETSLGFSKKKIKENNYGGFKRASELCEIPQLIIDGIDARDIRQGSLGDCWLLSSLAAIARFPHLIAHLFVKANVAMGQYTLRFFWRNEWKYVTVDDFVPITTDGDIMVVHSKDKNELWPTIVEKAIAKLFGNYAKVEGGDGTLGIYLFTGCLPQFEDLRNHVSCIEEHEEEGEEYEEEGYEDDEQDEEDQEEEVVEEGIVGGGLSFDEIWCCIVNGFNNGNAIGFGSDDNSGLGDEFTNEDGIVGGHYYALLDCLEYKGNRLVRLRNPCKYSFLIFNYLSKFIGGNTEWTGAWSDVSKEMIAQTKRDLNERVTEQANLIQQLCRNTGLLPVNDTASDRKSRKQKEKEEQDDGVFWMELGDVINHFGTMAIGHIVNIDHLFKEDNAFGFRFDQTILRSIHKSSSFPIFKQILKHDDKDFVNEDDSGCKTLTQQFNLTVDRKCETLIALRMIHNDMLKYNSYLELVCDELDIKSSGLYVFTGTRRKIPKGLHTFQVHSESRNGKFSDIEVSLLWENRQAHISLNEEEVEFE
ncbi:peptidase C2, calpain [Naegleria gruberi]|uniref:Peptidase C2, calpain n=1 Tax=Naegleria gruberi TaxID=5762 RepID=D2VPM6_NAEGR|nr:peptidase C2, calpain [Naegleria gruberi]EFC41234.1 peptidase C2, calpain [Naegleria gruberi]|eukprot:XP_002673978.1 peptidase C2, calpain [Naegleria gruberi strain NEG-M]